MSKYSQMMNTAFGTSESKALAMIAEQERIANLIKLLDQSKLFDLQEVVAWIKEGLDLEV